MKFKSTSYLKIGNMDYEYQLNQDKMKLNDSIIKITEDKEVALDIKEDFVCIFSDIKRIRKPESFGSTPKYDLEIKELKVINDNKMKLKPKDTEYFIIMLNRKAFVTLKAKYGSDTETFKKMLEVGIHNVKKLLMDIDGYYVLTTKLDNMSANEQLRRNKELQEIYEEVRI